MAEAFDLVVVGAGAAGMSAALTAHHLGLRVVIVEKTRWIGGSTAWSGGATWIPNNPHQIAADAAEPRQQALDYLRAEVGNHGRPELWDAFLDHGPQAIRFLEGHTLLQFTMRPVAPDYHPDQPGAALGHRVLDPKDFDGRALGPDLARLRPPIREFTVFGGMMVGRADIPHMFRMTREPRSALHAAGIVARHLRDRITHGRATRLVLGSAMAGRLLASCRRAGIEIRTQTAAERLLVEGGRVAGLEVRGPDRSYALAAARGVVLAGGGAARARALDTQLHPHAQARGHWSMAPEGSTGDSLCLTAALGVEPVAGNAEPLFYAPVSLIPQPGGAPPRPFPHLFLDRAKPGVYAVDATGRRFVNEAASYHDFVRAMLGRGPGRAPEGAVWLVADHATIRRYGLGAVRPFPAPLAGHLRSGYLSRGRSLDELAAAIGVPAAALAQTAAAVTLYAAEGHDPEQGKGSTAYNRYLGDPENRPNPCLGPLARGPFYAIRLHPGDIGAAVGLPIDPMARVLDRGGVAVPGLFACGNDANSIMGGTYPGAGITLGPALTFGFIAAHTAAGVALPRTDAARAEPA
jgi:succinate dehydrogenase/fumarate reductase flavoprotein subunit